VVVYGGLVNASIGVMNREYVPILYPLANNLKITKGVLLRPPVSLEEEYAWYDGLVGRKQTDNVFAILLHEKAVGGEISYRYVGHLGLHQMKWPDATATYGIVILDGDVHLNGCGTEACLLLLYHAFMVKGLHKVVAGVNGDKLTGTAS
jgi:RimJ/RimL family protein N-acetyltransferase